MKQEFTNFDFEDFEPLQYKEKEALSKLLQWIWSTKEFEGLFEKIVIEEVEFEGDLYSSIELCTKRGAYSICVNEGSLDCMYWGTTPSNKRASSA